MATGGVGAAGPASGTGPATRRSARGRLVGVDAARGLALIGMMAVHVLPGDAPDGSASTSYLIAGGRSAAAFAVLAGVGLALASGGTRPYDGVRRAGNRVAILVRAAAIAMLGLALGYADTGVAVILAYYGLLFVLALPFLGLRPRPAAVAAGVIAVVAPLLSSLLRADLPGRIATNPTFGDLLEDPVQLLVTLSLTGYYPGLAWTAYICAGLAVGRLALGTARVAATLVCGGAALAVVAAGGSRVLLGPLGGIPELAESSGLPAGELALLLDHSMYGTVPTDTWWWLAVDAPHSTTPFDLLHTIGTAVALLGAMLLVARVARPLLSPLAAAGSMTLTLYTAHVLALSTDWLPADPEQSWLLQIGVALLFATAWRRLLRRGPLEAVVGAVADRARASVARP